MDGPKADGTELVVAPAVVLTTEETVVSDAAIEFHDQALFPEQSVDASDPLVAAQVALPLRLLDSCEVEKPGESELQLALSRDVSRRSFEQKFAHRLRAPPSRSGQLGPHLPKALACRQSLRQSVLDRPVGQPGIDRAGDIEQRALDRRHRNAPRGGHMGCRQETTLAELAARRSMVLHPVTGEDLDGCF